MAAVWGHACSTRADPPVNGDLEAGHGAGCGATSSAVPDGRRACCCSTTTTPSASRSTAWCCWLLRDPICSANGERGACIGGATVTPGFLAYAARRSGWPFMARNRTIVMKPVRLLHVDERMVADDGDRIHRAERRDIGVAIARDVQRSGKLRFPAMPARAHRLPPPCIASCSLCSNATVRRSTRIVTCPPTHAARSATSSSVPGRLPSASRASALRTES